jgi:hypothetical protein
VTPVPLNLLLVLLLHFKTPCINLCYKYQILCLAAGMKKGEYDFMALVSYKAKNPQKRFRDLFKDFGGVENNTHPMFTRKHAATLAKRMKEAENQK